MVVRLYVQDSGEQISLFFIDKKGNLNVWTVSISDQFKRFGLNKSLIDPYLMKVKQLLHSNKLKIHSCPISKVDLDGFMSAVDEFIEIVQTAELKD